MPHRSAPKTKKEPAAGSVLQLKIRLLDVSPMIWRRVLVPATYTLEEFHGVIPRAWRITPLPTPRPPAMSVMISPRFMVTR